MIGQFKQNKKRNDSQVRYVEMFIELCHILAFCSCLFVLENWGNFFCSLYKEAAYGSLSLKS